MKKLFWILLTSLAAITACTSPSASPPTATPELALPTASPTDTPNLALNLDNLTEYTHSSHRFSVSYPAAWQYFEQPNGVIMLAPNNLAGYTVVFNEVGQPLNAPELQQYLLTFIAQNFADDAATFQTISQQVRPDGSLVAKFSWLDPVLGPSLGQVTLVQQAATIFILYFSAPEPLWEQIAQPLQTLVDAATLRQAPPTPAGAPTPATTPPVWTLIGPLSKEFGFLYASNWDILQQETTLVSVSRPKEKATFTASNFSWPGAVTDPTRAAAEAALAHIDTLKEEFEGVEHLPPTEFPLDTATGATIDFVYTAADGTLMAGSVITGVGHGKMHKLVFTAPTDFYEAALLWFNPMYKSFRFLSPTAGVDDEFIEQNGQ